MFVTWWSGFGAESAFLATGELLVRLSTDRDLLHKLLDIVVVDRYATVTQIGSQRLPVVAKIAQGLAKLALG